MKEFLKKLHDNWLSPVILAKPHIMQQDRFVDANTTFKLLNDAISSFQTEIQPEAHRDNQDLVQHPPESGSDDPRALNSPHGGVAVSSQSADDFTDWTIPNKLNHYSYQGLHNKIFETVMKIRAFKKELEARNKERGFPGNHLIAVGGLLQAFQAELNRIAPNSTALDNIQDKIILERDEVQSKFHQQNRSSEGIEMFFGGPPMFHSSKKSCEKCKFVQEFDKRLRESPIQEPLADFKKLVDIINGPPCYQDVMYISAAYHAQWSLRNALSQPPYQKFILEVVTILNAEHKLRFLFKLGLMPLRKEAQSQIIAGLKNSSPFQGESMTETILAYFSSPTRLLNLAQNTEGIESLLDAALDSFKDVPIDDPKRIEEEKRIQYLLTGLTLTDLVEGEYFNYDSRPPRRDKDEGFFYLPNRDGGYGDASAKQYDDYLLKEQTRRASSRKYQVRTIPPELRSQIFKSCTSTF